MALIIKDQNGNTRELESTAVAVGISTGTTDPENHLHIVGGNGNQLMLDNTGEPFTQMNLAAKGTKVSGLAVDHRSGFEGVAIFNQEAADKYRRISFRSSGSQDDMVINNGNVGIGTTEPPNPLTIAGPNNVGPNAATIELANTASTGRRFAIGSAEQGLFQIADLTAGGATRFVVKANGNVGLGGTLNPAERLVVEGNILATGDVRLSGGDCAEEFDVEDYQALDPGTVMIIGDEERLCQCVEAYDTKVAGVLSGAGHCKPGILLGKQVSQNKRMPLALTGKVCCKVDAQYGPIGTGDLLTTSSTPGHAMKVSDGMKASGAILGKALRPLKQGRGLIPILVALQ